MTDSSGKTTNDHLVSRRSAMQLLTALAGVGAFSGSVVADEDDDQQAEGEGEAGTGEAEFGPPVGTEQLLQYLAAKYGDVLSEEEVDALQDDVAGNIRNAQAMDGVDLQNGDDMALVFRAYRGSY